MPRDLQSLPLSDLFNTLLPTPVLRRACAQFLAEDVGSGDVTSRLTIPADLRGTARVVARESCVLAGIDAAVFLATSGRRDLIVVERARDGERLRAGAVVAVIEGRLRDLLLVERCVLNLLGRLSGVATMTAAFVDRLRSARGARAVLLDTRKTTPGLRLLEKYAVRAGGGMLHRIGLFDAVLVKDNHLAALAGQSAQPVTGATAGRRNARAKHANGAGNSALERLRAALTQLGPARRRLRFVEVEVDRLDQLAEILRWPSGIVDVVLLDNMTLAQLRRAVSMRDDAGSAVALEASGGVRLETVAAIARTGVDRISAGAITHAARSIDFSLEVDEAPAAATSAPTAAPARERARARSAPRRGIRAGQ